jgi:hypothetical protein
VSPSIFFKKSNRHIHFFELAGDFLEDFFVWDSGIWNTLIPLLFRPGFVTAEFLAGRKVRRSGGRCRSSTSGPVRR